MNNRTHTTSPRTTVRRASLLISMVLALFITSVPVTDQVADAQPTQTLEVWGKGGGLFPDAKIWRFRQSTNAANALGSAEAADPALDDSNAAGWVDQEIRWRDFPGPGVGNHFRKEFNLDDIDVELFQIVGIQAELQYDDSAILYLNGVEVYRSIRGNLDPTYATYPLGSDVPFDVEVPYGGAEQFYVGIPNVNGTNRCELTGPTCPTSPYGGPNPPAIPVSLLNDGLNTWSITTWNQIGGSGDSSIDHTFSLQINPNALPPIPVFINEVVAVNNGSWEVNIDDDPALETPDWVELVNVTNNDVDIAGWKIEDATASWTFPNGTIVPANGYLRIAASDNDRTDTTPLQTNFKLSSEGDSLKLTNASGIVADDYGVIPQQFADTSYGYPGDNTSADETYLDVATPGTANSVAGNGYVPILRPFANRMYNRGEAVVQQVNAFDPDGDSLTYTMDPLPPGITIDSSGAITGTAIRAGSFGTTITVTDSDGDAASQFVLWIVVPTVTGPSPIVLNEYNAVASDRDFLGGGVPVGNGGDWFEFLVIEDELDLRGYQFELYDRKGIDDQLRLAATVTIGSARRLASAPAGTLITISQDEPTDLSFDGVDDWHINLQIDSTANGSLFAPAGLGAVFNSTRSDQTVLIKDSTGTVVTPLSGETEAWDDAVAGVSGAEVMSLCASPTATSVLDPIADYLDNGVVSTFGEPNTCPDPNGGTVNQNLNTLRATATFGAGNGDSNCDGQVNVFDAFSAAEFFVGARQDSGPCFFDLGGPGHDMYADAMDVNDDGLVNTFDALIISRCIVGISEPWCP